MPRPTKGSVTEHVGKDGRTYRYLRFVAYGKRRNVRLGPVTAEQAETALRHTLADVERRTWAEPVAVEPPPEPSTVPTFGAFAMEWWALTKDQLAPNTQADYWWRLTVHLAPYFNEMCLDAITFDAVERYIARQLAEGERIRAAAAKGEPIMQEVTDKHGRCSTRPMRARSARSINMTLVLLGAILERAVERELIARNPARGKARRVKERTPARAFLDSAAQITALLAAASEMDRDAPKNRRHVERRAMIAVLVFSGLRISEMCALRWREVDLASGWLTVHGTKSDEADRRVKIRGALRDELLALRGRHQDAPQAAFVFATRSGARVSPDNFRSRVLGRPGDREQADGEQGKPGTGAVGRTNARLEAEGLPPLPKLTPHSLRRTFCSLLYALGETPPVVMVEMGHTDPALALRVYAQAMRRGVDEQASLRALVEGGPAAPAAHAETMARGA